MVALEHVSNPLYVTRMQVRVDAYSASRCGYQVPAGIAAISERIGWYLTVPQHFLINTTNIDFDEQRLMLPYDMSKRRLKR